MNVCVCVCVSASYNVICYENNTSVIAWKYAKQSYKASNIRAY